MECRYYQKSESGVVVCMLCPHHCHIANGKAGICRSRRNQGGVLVSEVYGRPTTFILAPSAFPSHVQAVTSDV